MATFKVRLKELRQSKGLTQRALAERLNISKSAVSMYENGSREPDHETTELIADFFNVDIDYLVGRSDMTTKFINPNSESTSSEYYNPESATLAQEMFDDPDMRFLFHAKQKMSPERFQRSIDTLKDAYKLENPDDDYGC